MSTQLSVHNIVKVEAEHHFFKKGSNYEAFNRINLIATDEDGVEVTFTIFSKEKIELELKEE